jgi:hypothetical protein
MLRAMRAVLAACMAVFLLVVAAGPHVHAGPDGADGCAVCVARHADVPVDVTPELAPREAPPVEAVSEPGRSPVAGAPLGAVPGQSPPRAS